jgi:low affinity Fe/Cu permease
MSKWFVNFAKRVAEASGYPSAFVAAVAMVIVWLATWVRGSFELGETSAQNLKVQR